LVGIFRTRRRKLVGNAGNEDLMVTPFLNSGANNFGEKINIERKTGKQTYTGTHFKAAVDHAIDKGASYAMLIYDTEENRSKKTTFTKDRGVLVAVVDLSSGMWRVAREIFEVLQKEVGTCKKAVNEINIDVLQEVAADIGTVVGLTAHIRSKSSKIQSLAKGIDEGCDEIKSAVNNYQHKLKSAIAGVETRNNG
jgi:hypothetical protein